MKRSDDFLILNCPVCGRKLLRTSQGEIEIQCPKCKSLLLAGIREDRMTIQMARQEEKTSIMMVAEPHAEYTTEKD